MRLPAVAIAAAFACGIALGLHPAVLPHVTSRFFLAVFFASSLVLIAAGLALSKITSLVPALTISLLSWALLGFLAACISEQPRPANHVTSLLEQKRLSLESLCAGTDACAMNRQSCHGVTAWKSICPELSSGALPFPRTADCA